MNSEGQEIENPKRKKIQQDLEAELGPARYQDYVRAQDEVFRDAYRMAQRLELGDEAALRAYEIKNEADRGRQLRQQNSNSSPIERRVALKSLRSRAEASLRELLGDQNFDLLKERSPNTRNWLEKLAE